MGDLLVRDVRLVPLPGAPAQKEPVDMLVRGGVVTQVGAALVADAPVLDAEGRYGIPGLWDAHVHLTQWAMGRLRLDTSAATSHAHLLALVRDHLAAHPDGVVQGFGHRRAEWGDPWRRADLDAVAGDRPVVLISGDAHHGLLSSAAERLLGELAHPAEEGVLEEAPWFAAYARLDALLPLDGIEEGVAAVVQEAHGRGVVGVVDLEFSSTLDAWPARVAAGIDTMRVRAGFYPHDLDRVLARGLRTGDPLWTATPDSGSLPISGVAVHREAGLVTTGPLKLITDGSLGTRTAHCCDPYPGGGCGTQNIAPDEMTRLLTTARANGLDVAVHAIGDAAAGIALDAFEATGAQGSIEHAQLLQHDDVPRLARLGLTASVQPAHLLDDRDAAERLWPGRGDRCFPLRALTDAGAPLALGSDAPVAPLDPWLAMAAAVHRSGDDRAPWHPEQQLTAVEALAASVDGRRVAPGQPGDLVLLDADPLAPGGSRETAARLRATRPSATVVAGRVVHGG